MILDRRVHRKRFAWLAEARRWLGLVSTSNNTPLA